jgi:hypothetical protein
MYAVLLGEYLTMFRKNSVSPSSETSILLLAPENTRITNFPKSLQLVAPAVQSTSEKNGIFIYLNLISPYHSRAFKWNFPPEIPNKILYAGTVSHDEVT